MCWTPVIGACLSYTGAVLNNGLWTLLVLDRYILILNLNLQGFPCSTWHKRGLFYSCTSHILTDHVHHKNCPWINSKNSAQDSLRHVLICLEDSDPTEAWFLLSFPTILVWVGGRWVGQERNDSIFDKMNVLWDLDQ